MEEMKNDYTVGEQTAALIDALKLYKAADRAYFKALQLCYGNEQAEDIYFQQEYDTLSAAEQVIRRRIGTSIAESLERENIMDVTSL